MKKQIIIAGVAGLTLLSVVGLPKVYAVDTVKTTVAANFKAAALDKAKQYATTIFNDHFIKRLNTLLETVNANTKLGTDAKTQIVSKINTEIAWFTAQRDSISSQTTVDAIKTMTRNARTRFLTDVKDVYRLRVAGGYTTALENVVSNFEKNIIAKVSEKLDALAAKGVNVTTEKALLEQAKAEVTTAKAKITEVRNSTSVEQMKTNYQAAREALKKAREDVKQIVQSLKSKVATTGTATTTPTATL